MNVSISKGRLPLKLMCQWTKKPFKVSPEFRAFWVLIRPLLSHVFSPFKKYCLLYLLEVSPPTDDCTLLCSIHKRDSVHSISTWSPNTCSVAEHMDSDFFPLLSWILDHTLLIFLELLCLELILGYVFRIYTCIACVKEQVASWLLKFFKNRIYLYA